MATKGNSITGNRFHEIETFMHEVQGLFTTIFAQMERSSKGLMGMPVNVSQLKALSAFDEDKSYSMGELCQLAQVKMPSMTAVADKLEDEGILFRVRDTGDRRVVKLCLTEQGKKMHGQILQARHEELSGLFGTLDEKDQSKLINSLKNVSAILRKVSQ